MYVLYSFFSIPIRWPPKARPPATPEWVGEFANTVVGLCLWESLLIRVLKTYFLIGLIA